MYVCGCVIVYCTYICMYVCMYGIFMWNCILARTLVYTAFGSDVLQWYPACAKSEVMLEYPTIFAPPILIIIIVVLIAILSQVDYLHLPNRNTHVYAFNKGK